MSDEPTISTRLFAIDDTRALPAALQALRRGEVVVFPTDTVYGVGCSLWDPRAIERLYWAKQRPEELAIPVLVADIWDTRQVARDLPQAFEALAERFWPGGLTLVLPKIGRVPAILSAGRDTVAVRLPAHPFARALIRAAGGALAVTSANRSGQPAPRTAEEAQAALWGRVAVILDGGPCPIGVASTIVDLTVSPPRVLRPGAIPYEALREVLPMLLPHQK
ncbi:MAG: threonylcarbamoyl-AMP synthase [Chloroflexi bacterium]|nr:threonylcarbamoyl-AMP synthase [Chloroflexota bacterium]